MAAGRVEFTASWPSIAAWGAGLVQCALGAGAIVGDDSDVLVRAMGILVVSLGAASLVWGAIALGKARLVAARLVLTGVLAGLFAMFGLLALAPARTSVFAVAAGAFLLLVVGATCAITVRRRGNQARDAGTARGVLGMFLAAAVVAVVVTPALGAAQDARLLTDDGVVPSISHDH